MRASSRNRRGLTLVEMTIVVALLGVVLGALGMVQLANDRAYRTGSTKAQLEAQIASVMQQVVNELRVASLETLTPDPVPGTGADSIRYQHAVGITGGKVELGTMRRLAIEYEDGETDDDADENGNGLVDECRLILITDVGGPDERRRILTRWVSELFEGEERNGADDDGNGLADERGFHVERIGETLHVRVTLQKRTTEGGTLTRTGRTSVRLRN